MFTVVGNIQLFNPVPDYVHNEVSEGLVKKLSVYFVEPQVFNYTTPQGPDVRFTITFAKSKTAGGEDFNIKVEDISEHWTPSGWTKAFGRRYALECLLSEVIGRGQNSKGVMEDAVAILDEMSEKAKLTLKGPPPEEPVPVVQDTGSVGTALNVGAVVNARGTLVATVWNASALKGPVGASEDYSTTVSTINSSNKEILEAVKELKAAPAPVFDPSLTPMQRRIKQRLAAARKS